MSFHIFFTRYEDNRYRVPSFQDKAFEREYRWLESKLPGKEIGFGARSKDENIWIVNAFSDTEPGETCSLGSQGESAHAAIPHPRRATARVALPAQSLPLQIV